MARTLQAAALPRIDARQLPTAAALGALGIVYGDIGTSALYGFKQAADAAGTLSPETIMGIVSVIVWSLIVIVSFKYAILIMRADNRGEGGIVALLALLDARHAPAKSWRSSLLVIGLIGAALLYGDGVITPAISVLSAVEGLKLDAPQLAPVVVPISIAILVGLFLVQRKGTAFIGNIFGPVMLIWFLAIGVLGLRGIIAAPEILGALSPHHALIYLLHAASPLSRARAREVAGNQRPWPADKVERWAIDRLIPYAKNARTHTDAQVAAIAASIKEWGWTSPALVGEDGGLIAGHARVLAARQLGIAEIPVMVAAGWTEAQKRAYVLADNQLAITGSGWDPELLRLELGELKLTGFDLSLTGSRASGVADGRFVAARAASSALRRQHGRDGRRARARW